MMNLTQEDIEPILLTVRSWLSKPNIVGLHIGRKIINTKETNQWAIIVDVIKKKNSSDFNQNDFPIPKEIELHVHNSKEGFSAVKIPTDVIETGSIIPNALNTKRRPCPGGYKIQGTGINGAGTLGVNIAWGGKYRLLTNNHVISWNGKIGKRVWQPINDLGNSLTKVTGYITIVTYANQYQPHPVFNKQDLAWCDITLALGSNKIEGLGVPNGIRRPVNGERISVIGQKTGIIQHAHIMSINATVSFNIFGDQYAWFENMIKLDSAILQSGDSGAAYMGDDGMIVGLHCAGSNLFSYGCFLTFH